MIVRHYIICETCSHPHTIRVQVGHERYQEHSFNCFECGEEIIIGMHCYPETASVKIKEIENAKPGEEEGTIINLSPGFPISPGDLHRDLAFPSIEHVRNLLKAQKELGLEPPSFSSFEEARHKALNTPSLPQIWAVVKKGWSLTSRGRDDLAEEQFKKYPIEDFNDPPKLNYVLFDFCGRMLMPSRYSLFVDAANKVEEISKKYPNEFLRFKGYYKTNMERDNLARYFEVFKEFFRCFNDFSQTLTFVQHAVDLPDDYVASSYAFGKTKLFYGNSFEALTSNIAVLACINNIANNRKFDEFKQMSLSKYLTINKANRANPFKEVAEFSAIASCLDSTLRNASHHGSAKLSNDGKTLQYRSGGTGKQRSMSYREYLDRCNEIMLCACALLALELAIGF